MLRSSDRWRSLLHCVWVGGIRCNYEDSKVQIRRLTGTEWRYGTRRWSAGNEIRSSTFRGTQRHLTLGLGWGSRGLILPRIGDVIPRAIGLWLGLGFVQFLLDWVVLVPLVCFGSRNWRSRVGWTSSRASFDDSFSNCAGTWFFWVFRKHLKGRQTARHWSVCFIVSCLPSTGSFMDVYKHANTTFIDSRALLICRLDDQGKVNSLRGDGLFIQTTRCGFIS